jgi:hypothetical protein
MRMNGTFRIEIEMGNAAMLKRRDIADALIDVSNKLKCGQAAGGIMDVNGNTVGKFWME